MTQIRELSRIGTLTTACLVLRPRLSLSLGLALRLALSLALSCVEGRPALGLTGEACVRIESPDGRNAIALHADDGGLIRYAVERDGRPLVRPSAVGPVLVREGPLGDGARIVEARQGNVDESFELPRGKTRRVTNRHGYAVVTLATPTNVRWQIELRAFDDAAAIRYRLMHVDESSPAEIAGETTEFDVAGEPTALFNALSGFRTSHESLYERKPFAQTPTNQLIEMPMLFSWPDGKAAAITEARVRGFAGMYLERRAGDRTALGGRLSPRLDRPGVCVVAKAPIESPWRVVLLADSAGKLLESNALLCLNDAPTGDFSWARPGKTTFHWWYGDFEEDHRLAEERSVYVARHKAYIDFCARNRIAYHAVSGDGYAWYRQSPTDYANPAPDADVTQPRAEMGLPEIIEYGRQRGVGIRLWVHWKPLSEQLEEAFATYESWGIQGLMVDFFDRDDQEILAFVERMLECAARHRLHIQIHGSSKYSGEQRTFPHFFNREGVLNLEYVKWSQLCTPDHNVNVAYTRALAGPVDYHLGGFRSVSRAEFAPQYRAPVVLGTRCHNMALYVVYENPLPIVADAPSAYEEQSGFEFLVEVPTTWDETRFVAGEPGEFVVLARRRGEVWYLGGVSNWTQRTLNLPTDFLESGQYEMRLYEDGSLDEANPNEVRVSSQRITASNLLSVATALAGGFVAVVRPARP